MTLNYSKLKILLSLYLGLPLFVFAVGYLRWHVCIPFLAVLSIAVFFYIRRDKYYIYNDLAIEFNWKIIVLIVFIVLLWTWFGGLNGFFYQTSDWEFRNPIYRDLITHEWPVVYEWKNSAMSYYIGFWLVPAAISKPFYSNLGILWGWRISRIVLWLWASAGLVLVILCIFLFVKANNTKKQIISLLVFMFFSGLDIIGVIQNNEMDYVLGYDAMHLEWWNSLYQYSSITTCVYWVFNQAILPWLVIIAFMLEKDSKSYVFLGMACFISGPFPFVGLVVLMITREVITIIKKAKIKNKIKYFLQNTLSISNILSATVIFPIIATFYLSNNAWAGGVTEQVVSDTSPILTTTTYGTGIMFAFITKICEFGQYLIDPTFLTFYIYEVGIYLVLIFLDKKKDILYWAVAFSLLIIPYFHVGVSNDFCMRVSIPAIFILMLYCNDVIINRIVGNGIGKSKSLNKIRYVLLICALLIGSCTPVMEICRGWTHVIKEKTFHLSNETIFSLENLEPTLNFESSEYSDKIFFKYFAKQ